MSYLYFDTPHALKVQNFIIENSGGRKGVLNMGLIDSVLEHVKNDIYYPQIEDKICHIFYSINKNHAFNDGNKRSSIVLASYFMEINGLDYKIDYFIKEMENIAVHVADNKISKDLLYKIIVSIVYDNEYTEELQLDIINAISIIEEADDENLF